MKELIAPLESAAGPSRALDLRIWCETGQEGSGEGIPFYTSQVLNARELLDDFHKFNRSRLASFRMGWYLIRAAFTFSYATDERLARKICAEVLKARDATQD